MYPRLHFYFVNYSLKVPIWITKYKFTQHQLNYRIQQIRSEPRSPRYRHLFRDKTSKESNLYSATSLVVTRLCSNL